MVFFHDEEKERNKINEKDFDISIDISALSLYEST